MVVKIPCFLGILRPVLLVLICFFTSYSFAAEEVDAPLTSRFSAIIKHSYYSTLRGLERTIGHSRVFPELSKFHPLQNAEIGKSQNFLETIGILRKLSFSKVHRPQRLHYLSTAIGIGDDLDDLLFEPKNERVNSSIGAYHGFYERTRRLPSACPTEAQLENFRATHKENLLRFEDVVSRVQERCKRADALYKAFHELLTSNIPEETRKIFQDFQEAMSSDYYTFGCLLQKYFNPSYDSNSCEHNALVALKLMELLRHDFDKLGVDERVMFILTVILSNESERDPICDVELREITNPLVSPLSTSTKKTLRELLASITLDFSEKYAHKILSAKEARALIQDKMDLAGGIRRHSVLAGMYMILRTPGVIALNIKQFLEEGGYLKGARNVVLMFRCGPKEPEFLGYLSKLRGRQPEPQLLKEQCVNIEAFFVQKPGCQGSGIFGKLQTAPRKEFYSIIRANLEDLLFYLASSYDLNNGGNSYPMIKEKLLLDDPLNIKKKSSSDFDLPPDFDGILNIERLTKGASAPIPIQASCGLLHFTVTTGLALRRVRVFGDESTPALISPTTAIPDKI